MEHDGEAGELLHNRIEHLECQWRGNKTTLGVACALLGSELISPVAGTNRNSQRIATGAGGEVDNLFGVSVGVMVRRNLILNTGKNTKLTFHSHVILMCIINNLLGQSHVLLIGEMRAVDHH